MKKYKVISYVLVVCMVLTMMPAAVFAETGANAGSQAVPAEQTGQTFADMTGHWAAQAVSKWAEMGIVKGDSKGLRPDDSITRAELAVILDNLMDYQSKSDSTFSDVKSGAWYADAVAKASAAGILNGDGAGHALPDAKVTREQAAVMLARAFGVDENDGKKTAFKDASFISNWAKTLVFGMEEDKYIGGMGTGNFEPKSYITRAQIVTMIDNAVVAYYTKAGVYADNVTPKTEGANCVAIVKTSGVILKSAVVSGDLIVAEGVANGDFTLDGATVAGKLIARGGGENSIHVINGANVKGKVTIEKVDGVVRIVSNGVVIATLEADAEVILEGEFTNVTVAEGASVEVRGKVAKLDVTGKAEIKAAKESRIENITIEDGAKGTNLNIDKNAEINKLEAKADMTTAGAGAPKSVTGTGSVTKKEAAVSGSSSGGGSGGGGGTGDVPAVLPEISTVEFYLDYDYNTGEFSEKVTTEVPAMLPDDDSMIYAKVLLKDGTICNYANYTWVLESGGEEIPIKSGTNKGCWLYTDGTDADSIMKLTVTGYAEKSQGNVTASIIIRKPIQSQSAPSGLTGVGVSSSDATDGKISGTTEAMEYRLSTAEDSAYVTCTAGEVTGLALGTYYVRLKAKPGYVASWRTEVDVWMNQAAPTGLIGIAPTGEYSGDAKISNTTADMQWKRSSELYYSACSAGVTTVTLPGTYHVRYPAVPGQYYASVDAVVTIAPYVAPPNQDQAAPEGLTAEGPSHATGNNGKIIGTTTGMEYTSVSGSNYSDCSADETAWLYAGTYYVRYKAKPGYNASMETEVVITAPAVSHDATLQSLSYIYTYNGAQEETSVPSFDPSTTSYDISLYGNVYGKSFNLNPYASDPGFATVTYSAVTVGTGEYTAVLKAEVTAEDGVTKLVYTVNITVERRSGTMSISPDIYEIASDAVPVITLHLTDRDGTACSLQEMMGTAGSVSIKDQIGDPIGAESYTVDNENSTITIKKEYFSDMSAGMQCYFNIDIITEEGDIVEVQRVFAPYVTITD